MAMAAASATSPATSTASPPIFWSGKASDYPTMFEWIEYVSRVVCEVKCFVAVGNAQGVPKTPAVFFEKISSGVVWIGAGGTRCVLLVHRAFNIGIGVSIPAMIKTDFRIGNGFEIQSFSTAFYYKGFDIAQVDFHSVGTDQFEGVPQTSLNSSGWHLGGKYTAVCSNVRHGFFYNMKCDHIHFPEHADQKLDSGYSCDIAIFGLKSVEVFQIYKDAAGEEYFTQVPYTDQPLDDTCVGGIVFNKSHHPGALTGQILEINFDTGVVFVGHLRFMADSRVRPHVKKNLMEVELEPTLKTPTTDWSRFMCSKQSVGRNPVAP